MKNKEKKIFYGILGFISIIVVTSLIEWVYFGFKNLDITSPALYSGDGLTGLVGINNLISENGNSFGWPFFSQTKYTPCYNALYRILIFILSSFTSNYIIIQNIYIFLIPLANVVVCYYVLRKFEIRRIISFLCSLAFGFCPYVQWRLGGHMALASIECIPLVFLMVSWLFEDKNFAVLKKSWYKNSRNWLSILFAFLIANNGMVYYPFFTCFIFVVMAIMCAIMEKNIKGALPAITVILEIVICLAVGFIPTIIGLIRGAGNSATNGAIRDAYRATVYGLDIKSLILSPKGFGFDKIKDQYQYLSDLGNERSYAYIGVLAIVGLLILLLMLFVPEKKDDCELFTRIKYLSKINISMILLATINSFGVVVAVVIPYISCYNRISPFIVFASLLCVALVVEYALTKIEYKKIASVILVFFMIACLYEARGCYNKITTEHVNKNLKHYNEDKEFFEEIGESSKSGAMIFQLPYMKSFENGATVDIPDYDHMKGSLFIDAKWSYGAALGTKNDIWYSGTSALPVEKQIEELRQKGFDGIYLNLNGYEKEIREDVLNEYKEKTGCNNPIMHANGKIYYFTI